jgi:hypothetical protein
MAQERDMKRTRKVANGGTHAFVPELAAAAPEIEHQRELPGPVVAAMVERSKRTKTVRTATRGNGR